MSVVGAKLKMGTRCHIYKIKWGLGREAFSEILIFELSFVVYSFPSELMKVRGGIHELEGNFF